VVAAMMAAAMASAATAAAAARCDSLFELFNAEATRGDRHLRPSSCE
jgi:hypothetical protein